MEMFHHLVNGNVLQQIYRYNNQVLDVILILISLQSRISYNALPH